MNDLLMKSDAVISPCGMYRYRLSRTWGEAKAAAFIMLNPSTADASEDDPTIRRCIGFAKSWGGGGLVVVNLFAFRATSPKDLIKAADPIGPGNHDYIFEAVYSQDIAVCAWGTKGDFMNQNNEVVRYIRSGSDVPLACLGVTKDGHPRHPLYLPKDAERHPYPSVNGTPDHDQKSHTRRPYP